MAIDAGLRGRRGRRLLRRRGETIERSFAHLYDTGGMRLTHLRGHTNILKRVLIHAGGFNLGLVMRHLIGCGTPRGLTRRLTAVGRSLHAPERDRTAVPADHVGASISHGPPRQITRHAGLPLVSDGAFHHGLLMQPRGPQM